MQSRVAANRILRAMHGAVWCHSPREQKVVSKYMGEELEKRAAKQAKQQGMKDRQKFILDKCVPARSFRFGRPTRLTHCRGGGCVPTRSMRRSIHAQV